MPLPRTIYRRLDFGINVGDSIERAPSQITCEKPDNVQEGSSSGRKRKIEDVPYGEHVPVRKSLRLAIKALKSVLSKRCKQAEERSYENTLAELNKSSEVQILKELETSISHLDGSLQCELEAISGHQSTAALSVYPQKEKSYRKDLGSFQPVRLLFSPSGHYKFQVFIYRTLEEGKIDLRDKVAVERVVEKIRLNSGFAMCPGIVDYDAIISDIRIQPSNVKEEIWPWRHVSAIKCKLWHKPRKQQLSEGMPESVADVCGECKLVRRKMLVLRDKRKSLDENDRLQRQQASSKVRLSVLSPESQEARQENVRRERKNYRRIAERMIQRSSVAVNEKQNSELVTLINCLESCKEGQEGLAKVFNEADSHKPGSGAVIREMWQMEKAAFFKDQRKNGRLKHNCYNSFYFYYISRAARALEVLFRSEQLRVFLFKMSFIFLQHHTFFIRYLDVRLSVNS